MMKTRKSTENLKICKLLDNVWFIIFSTILNHMFLFILIINFIKSSNKLTNLSNLMPSGLQVAEYIKPSREMREITNSATRPLYFQNPLTKKENLC